MPRFSAVSASTVRPVTMRSNARDAPMRRGSRYVTPMSVPVSPVLMNAEQKVAERAAMRRSQASASDRPPPNAGPLTAASTICGVARMCWVRLAMNDWPPVLARGRRGAEVAEVEARAEPATGAGEHGNLAALVGRDLVERIVEIRDELERDRVEPIRTGEPDHPDRIT